MTSDNDGRSASDSEPEREQRRESAASGDRSGAPRESRGSRAGHSGHRNDRERGGRRDTRPRGADARRSSERGSSERGGNDRGGDDDRRGSDRKGYDARPGRAREGAPHRTGGSASRGRGAARDSGSETRDRGPRGGHGKPRVDGDARGYRGARSGDRNDGARRPHGDAKPWERKGGPGQQRDRAPREPRPDRPVEPAIPEEVTARDLDGGARNQLKTLSKENADQVARHLAMAARLIDEDPRAAHEHALAAERRAGRVAVVRESVAITAYAVGDFALALRELRTYRRISGNDDQIALIVDSERGVGRPERALEEGRGVDRSRLPVGVRVELAIAMSGARLDLGQPDRALAELDIPELDPERAYEWSPGLFAARAAVLEELGRDEESAIWHRRAVVAADALDEVANTSEILEVFEEFDEDEEDDAAPGRPEDESLSGAPGTPVAPGAAPVDGEPAAESEAMPHEETTGEEES